MEITIFIQKSKKEYFCENCKFDFFTNSAAEVIAIKRDKKGRIMLTKRAFNPWKRMLDLLGVLKVQMNQQD